MAPSSINIVNHYAVRSPQSILYLREDTLSQLLNLANIRPGGRYLVVDDTGGLVTAAIADRMGCEGRILLFNDADSPPAWGVLNVMNFGERELSFIKWLNWMEAEEDYSRRRYRNWRFVTDVASWPPCRGRYALYFGQQVHGPYAQA
jgi:tRNA (adenine-N(1)-)-methyltransferase non-catalytic subunit